MHQYLPSVTLRPFLNWASMPSFFSQILISGPPPCTSTGLTPMDASRTRSLMTPSCAASQKLSAPNTYLRQERRNSCRRVLQRRMLQPLNKASSAAADEQPPAQWLFISRPLCLHGFCEPGDLWDAPSEAALHQVSGGRPARLLLPQEQSGRHCCAAWLHVSGKGRMSD